MLTVISGRVKQALTDARSTGDLPRCDGRGLSEERQGNRKHKSLHMYQNLVIKERRETW